MRTLYNILTYIIVIVLKIASLFNKKLKLGIIGRSETFQKLEASIDKTDKVIWFHCASLGEYEQGFPLFEQLRSKHHEYKIVLSFFSPSGYEIKKDTPIADAVVYLPFDTKRNAKRFINVVHPELIVFVKYEVWPNYFEEIKKRQIKAVLISALFRERQIYFKPYGSIMRKALFAFDHIFTQDQASIDLLKSIHYTNTTISGDTRFDRVSDQLKMDNNLDFISEFKQDKLCIVAGSTWHEDEQLLVEYINSKLNSDTKIVIAPHNIKTAGINKLKDSINKSVVLFSERDNSDLLNAQILILNTIGLLSRVYSYADIAYVGGAMGNTGLHNTLEAAVFGIPIVIGKDYEKFPEAKAMIKNKGMFSIKTQKELNTILEKVSTDSNYRLETGVKNSDYVKKNQGAVTHILNYLLKK